MVLPPAPANRSMIVSFDSAVELMSYATCLGFRYQYMSHMGKKGTNCATGSGVTPNQASSVM